MVADFIIYILFGMFAGLRKPVFIVRRTINNILASADNTYLDLDYSGYHKNRI